MSENNEIDFMLLLRQDGVKTALKEFMTIVDRAAEIRLKFPDKRLTELRKTYFNNESHGISNSCFLDNDPITLMASGFILLENDNKLQRAIGRTILKQGFEEKKKSTSKNRGRPASLSKKLLERSHLIEISRASDSHPLNQLYQEYSKLEHKSVDTIRRRYERFKKENQGKSDEDMVLDMCSLYKDYIADISGQYFFYQAVEDIKSIQGFNSKLCTDLCDHSLFEEAYCEYCVELFSKVLNINYEEAKEKFIKISPFLSFTDVDTLKRMLGYI